MKLNLLKYKKMGMYFGFVFIASLLTIHKEREIKNALENPLQDVKIAYADHPGAGDSVGDVGDSTGDVGDSVGDTPTLPPPAPVEVCPPGFFPFTSSGDNSSGDYGGDSDADGGDGGSFSDDGDGDHGGDIAGTRGSDGGNSVPDCFRRGAGDDGGRGSGGGSDDGDDDNVYASFVNSGN